MLLCKHFTALITEVSTSCFRAQPSPFYMQEVSNDVCVSPVSSPDRQAPATWARARAHSSLCWLLPTWKAAVDKS